MLGVAINELWKTFAFKVEKCWSRRLFFSQRLHQDAYSSFSFNQRVIAFSFLTLSPSLNLFLSFSPDLSLAYKHTHTLSLSLHLSSSSCVFWRILTSLSYRRMLHKILAAQFPPPQQHRFHDLGETNSSRMKLLLNVRNIDCSLACHTRI